MSKHTHIDRTEQDNNSAYLQDRCYQFLLSFLVILDAYLDRRLVETFLGLVMAVIETEALRLLHQKLIRVEGLL